MAHTDTPRDPEHGPELIPNVEAPETSLRSVLVLHRREESVPTARAYVTLVLRSWSVDGRVVDNAELLISELVTNAVQHTDGHRIVVHLVNHRAHIRCEVHDGDRTPPTPSDIADLEAETGRGLGLVQAIATHWGTRLDTSPPLGKTVWFDLSHEQTDAALPRRSPQSLKIQSPPAALVDPALLRQVFTVLLHG